MRWLPLLAALLAALLAGPLWAEDDVSSPGLKEKLRTRIVETLPPAPVAQANGSAATGPAVKPASPASGSLVEKSSPPVVARAGRPIPRLSAETMLDEWMRQTAGQRQPVATAKASSGATEKKGEGPQAADPEVFVLPKLEVTAQRLTELEARVREIDGRQRAEERAMTPTWVDALLDLPVLSFLFGGNTAERRAATARARVEVMRWERVLQAAREMAKTPEEKAQIEEDIRLLGELTRYWE